MAAQSNPLQVPGKQNEELIEIMLKQCKRIEVLESRVLAYEQTFNNILEKLDDTVKVLEEIVKR